MAEWIKNGKLLEWNDIRTLRSVKFKIETDNSAVAAWVVEAGDATFHLSQKVSAIAVYGGIFLYRAVESGVAKMIPDAMPVKLADGTLSDHFEDTSEIRQALLNAKDYEDSKIAEIWVSDPRLLMLTFTLFFEDREDLTKPIEIPTRETALAFLEKYGLGNVFNPDPDSDVLDKRYKLMIRMLDDLRKKKREEEKKKEGKGKKEKGGKEKKGGC